jgi:DNA-directed RNA polymerase subunit RPC12/RpoP
VAPAETAQARAGNGAGPRQGGRSRNASAGGPRGQAQIRRVAAVTIIAQFPGTCPRCGGRIRPGERVEWAKGSPAVHAGCAGTGRTHRVAGGAPAPAAAPGRAPAPAPARASAETRTCWECGRRFTRADARRNGGDWGDSYCGC